MACKKKKQSQLHIFEFYEHQKNRDNVIKEVKEKHEQDLDMSAKATSRYVKLWTDRMIEDVKIVNYIAEEDDPMPQVHLNHNCSMVMFHSA